MTRFSRQPGWSLFAAVFWLAGSGCQAPSASKARPAEVPIGDFRADAPPASEPDSTTATTASSAVPSSATAPAKEDDVASASGAGDAVATKLDDKNGFAGASFGQAPRAFRGLKAADKKGERVTFHVPAGAVYAGAPLNHLDYTFTKNKLGVIAFTVKNSADCKTVRAALERELGAPQKAIAAPESALWKGAKVALRFSGGVTCGGTVASHDLAGSDYTALDN